MTGVDKIILKIEEDCRITCEEIIAKAQTEAQLILDNAHTEAKKIQKEIISATNNKCRADIELSESKAEHEYKNAILASKINIINDMINESMYKLKNLPAPEYFNIITVLIKRYAQNGCGTLRFSQKDLDRLPDGFENELNGLFKDSGRSFTVSHEALPTDGGVVIVYNDIEQNCTFDSLLESSLDEIKDSLFEEVFMRKNV